MSASRFSRFILACGLFCLAACSSSYSSAPQEPAPVASVAAGPTGLLLKVGGTKQLTVVVKDASGTVLTDRTVTWTTDSPDVAVVSASGLVTATGLGYVTIIVTCEGKTFGVAATVTPE
jgi:uncharacterized protein YjdB